MEPDNDCKVCGHSLDNHRPQGSDILCNAPETSLEDDSPTCACKNFTTTRHSPRQQRYNSFMVSGIIPENK